MSGAEELLNSGSSTYLARPESEPHIVVGENRFITVPAELKRIAVQFDHDVETVTFDCPRYWDGLDMSKMGIYINYMRADKAYGCFRAENVAIDEADENIMHFTWTISKNVTLVKGNLQFLVCVRKADDEDNEINHWNSELCTDMYVSEGMECAEVILPEYPDILSQWYSEVKAIMEILLNARDAGEFNGATFVPYVDEEGNISWTNDLDFPNPETQNIRGARYIPHISEDGTLTWTNDKGLPNPEGTYVRGATYIPHISSDGIISWTNDRGLPNPDPVFIRGAAGVNAIVVSELEPATGPVLWFDTSTKSVE